MCREVAALQAVQTPILPSHLVLNEIKHNRERLQM